MSRTSEVVFHAVALALALVIGFSGFSETAFAQGNRPRQTFQLPDLSTHEGKMEFLRLVRESFPTLRQTSRLEPEDVDQQLMRLVQQESSAEFAGIVDDATFLRRVSLDLTGRIPSSADVETFVADTNPHKRSAMIDALLETEAYSRKWARFWQNVIFEQSDANRNSINPQALEDWLCEQFQAGTTWDLIAAELVSATPQRQQNVRPQDNGWQQNHGPNNFILACERKPEVIASQTARIFMGISIGCAECHDHPFEDWKREQFHEMAAFFAPGRYYMTDQYDPTLRTQMQPRFLLDEEPPGNLRPDERRVALAAYLVYNPDNYWFARAYVNRIWSELLGDGFYSVDSLGPDQEVVHVLAINRISAAFRVSGFDPHWLFRLICNTQAYQREIRTVDNSADLFTAVRPARIRPYEVADNILRLIGGNEQLSRAINQTFAQNLSVPQSELEGTIQQALLMMNHPQIHQRLSQSELKQQLVEIADDRELVRQAFLGMLAREPSDLEYIRYERFLENSSDRRQATDDILWVLLNSAEFISKR